MAENTIQNTTAGKEFVQIRRAVYKYCRKDNTDKKALRAALEANDNTAAALLYPFAGKQTFPTIQALSACLVLNTESALQVMRAYYH